MIIDASVGMTEKDILMFNELTNYNKNFIIVANKVDRLTQSEYHKKITEIKKLIGGHEIIPFSTKTKKGTKELINKIFE